MSSVSAVARVHATESRCPPGQLNDQMVSDVLVEISRALWPTKTAENIAAHCGCTVRAAARYLSGEREWSSDALAAIVAEILRRHHMRNVRVIAREK